MSKNASKLKKKQVFDRMMERSELGLMTRNDHMMLDALLSEIGVIPDKTSAEYKYLADNILKAVDSVKNPYDEAKSWFNGTEAEFTVFCNNRMIENMKI